MSVCKGNKKLKSNVAQFLNELLCEKYLCTLTRDGHEKDIVNDFPNRITNL